MTIIFLSTSVMNTVEDNRQASQVFTIKRSCHINIFYADRFGTYCSGCILEHVKTVTQNPSAPAARSPAVGVTPIWEHHPPPTLRKKSTPLLQCHCLIMPQGSWCPGLPYII